jgi:hypothetical protein
VKVDTQKVLKRKKLTEPGIKLHVGKGESEDESIAFEHFWLPGYFVSIIRNPVVI